MQLKLSLMKLQEVGDFDEVLFWGKIKGITKDYYIALGLKYKGYYEFPNKKFYWSSINFNFSELPELNDQHKEKAGAMCGLFTGDYEKVLVQVETPENPDEEEKPPEVEVDDHKEDALSDTSEEEEIKIPPKNFTELDRLCFVVRALENDCNVVPEGSFKLTPIHEVRRNENFKGLNSQELTAISKYQHFRNVQLQEKKEFIERDDALFYPNFLDSLDYDLPRGAWSIHLDCSKTIATIRSLLWPGYVAYHRANTLVFGGCYIGDGIKNKDLPFMI